MPDPRRPAGLLDTSVVIDLERIAEADLPQEVAISSLTMAELAAGPHATSDLDERARRQELVRVMVDALQALQVEFEEDPPVLDAQSGRFVRCGSLTLDQEKRLAIVDAADDAERSSAELTVNEAILLAHLMRRPDTALSCRELALDALGYDVSEKEAQEIVRPHISRLRSKIEPDATPPRWIRTIRGKGYMLSCS